MIVFVAGMARSGSTWTFNVTREIIRAAGLKPIPEEQEQDEDALLQQVAQTDPGPQEVFCIKTHRMLRLRSDDIRLICNYRDMRSAALSFMRFMGCDFERTLKAVREMMEITDFYRESCNEKQLLLVRYDDMMEQPQKVILEIASLLGIALQEPFAFHLARKYSRENVKRLLESMQSIDVDQTFVQRQPGQRFEPRYFSNNQGGVYDRRTSFHSGHLTSSNEDEWREYFTPEQQATLNELCGSWLERYGFAV
ncbi:MAG: hypothetical protein D6698_13935 [Gammaproteobacteria bacterium]|nr:MAG: hypothetical protein D6698_13935 [Gammaproteobacteria bacterium]